MSTWTSERHEQARRELLDDRTWRFGPDHGADALDEIERLAPFEAHVAWLWHDTEPGKTPDDMVERAAIQMCATERHADVWAMLTESERDDLRADARTALGAALNPPAHFGKVEEQ